MASNNFSHSGKIISVNGRRVQVGFSSQGACAGCQARSKCGMVDSSNRQVEVIVSHAETYTVGQSVNVAISYKMGVMSVLIAYIAPLIILIGVLCCTPLLGVNEGVAAILSLGAVALYYVIVYTQRSKLDKQIKFTIEE